ncbi:MAG: hypothetical protein IJZ80_07280 [Clostridia bacterium]|nr:hypothetical protein [Clostridia bacterium]
MKFSDYLFSPEARRSAIKSGLFTGVLIGIGYGWKFGLLTGAVTALIMSFFTPMLTYLQDLPYIKIKKTFTTPILIDKRVHFTVQKGFVRGMFLLTADQQIIFLSVDRGEHRLELSRAEIREIKRSDDMTISFFVNDTQFVRLISGECEEIVDTLLQNGWVVGN